MSANISAQNIARTLDRVPETVTPLAETDVQDASTLIRTLTGLLRDIAALKGRWWPRRFDFEDRSFSGDGTTIYRLEHRFGGRVRLFAVEWDSSGAGAFDYSIDADRTDANTIAFVTHVAGTGVIRVEAAG